MGKFKIPTAEELKEIRRFYGYEPETGAIFRKEKKRNGALAGTRADHKGRGGYRKVKYKSIPWPAHRLAWFLQTGEWPLLQVDHKDLNRSNNVWTNLRLATHGQNQANGGLYKNNTLKTKGVSPIPNRSYPLYRARIRKDGIEHFLGVYRTIPEAKAAYDEAAKRMHGEFWRSE